MMEKHKKQLSLKNSHFALTLFTMLPVSDMVYESSLSKEKLMEKLSDFISNMTCKSSSIDGFIDKRIG